LQQRTKETMARLKAEGEKPERPLEAQIKRIKAVKEQQQNPKNVGYRPTESAPCSNLACQQNDFLSLFG
jgi:hypothetical protein